MTNGGTLIKIGTAELHELLPRCKDHPALVDDDAATADALLLMLLELVEPLVDVPVGLELAEPFVVVPVGVRTADVTIAVKGMSVEACVVTELGIERDVAGSVVPGLEPEDTDDDEVPGPGEEIRVMANEGLVSPESPNKTMR